MNPQAATSQKTFSSSHLKKMEADLFEKLEDLHDFLKKINA